MTLHLIGGKRQIADLAACQASAADKDTVVLMGQAVALADKFTGKQTLHLVPGPDDKAPKDHQKQVIDYPKLVALCAEHARIICW